ncbi:MAG: hypothetical protein ACT4O9_04840 [Blastocatellia bacterium]
MSYIEPETYAMLIRPINTEAGFQKTSILGFFAGHANSADVLKRTSLSRDAAYISVTSEHAAKLRKFTVMKPHDDVTFTLLRSHFSKDKMKAALVFMTEGANFRLTIKTDNATIQTIHENRTYKTRKVDIVQFNIESAIMTSEINLFPK